MPTGRFSPHRLPCASARYVGDTGYYLLYLNAAGEEQTDTWHETLDAAQHQAELEFGVHPSDWRHIEADV